MVPQTTVSRSQVGQPPAGSGRIGTIFDGRYRILRLLGEGGMGAVFLAEHVVLSRQVAIKFLHPDFARQEAMVGRFHREARAAAATHHRNIIEVLDVGFSPQGEPFLVMEFLEGESLAQLLKRASPLNLSEACAVIEQALLGLGAAHGKGIIHRDLKPDNLFLSYPPNEPPIVKLIDFGISKFAQAQPDAHRTKTGSVLGTPAYMSPEQARALPGLDHRSDLYSIGTIFYEMLTGSLPFAGASFADYLANLVLEQPRPPRSLRPDFPAEAEPVLVKALAKDPDVRFQSAEEMLGALRRLKSFADRIDRLTLLASSVEVRGFAAGDLGESLPAEMLGEGSGRPWWDAANPVSSRPRRRIGLLAAGLTVGLGAVVALGVIYSRRGASRESFSPAAEVAKAPAAAPAPVPAAPLPAEVPAPTAIPAAKEARPSETQAGLDRGEREFVPAKVSTRGKPRARPARAAASEAAATPSPAESSEQKSSRPTLRPGARGTKISESFE